MPQSWLPPSSASGESNRLLCPLLSFNTFSSLLRDIRSGGFPSGSVGKNPTASAGDVGSAPGSGRSPGEGDGSSLQYSGLENPLETPSGPQSWGRKE